MKIIKNTGKRIDLTLEQCQPEIKIEIRSNEEIYRLLSKIIITLYENGFEVSDPDLLNLIN